MQRGLHRGRGEATPSVGAQAPVAHTIRGRCVTKLCHHVRVVTPVCRRVSLIETAKSLLLALALLLSVLPPPLKMFALSHRLAVSARTSARVGA